MANFQLTTAIQHINAKLQKALEALAEEETEVIRESIGTPYPPASDPGQPPHLRSGDLQRGVKVEVIPNGVRIVSEAPYSSDLEFGAPAIRLAARPFMRPALYRLEGEIDRLAELYKEQPE